MNTMQEGIDKAIAENIESVLFYMKDGMTKEQAMTFQRKSSCMGDKIWEQVSRAIDVVTAEQLAQTLIKSEWMVIGKLQEMQVTDLLGGELRRAFAGCNEWRQCHKLVRQLMRRGLTFEMLSEF